MKLTFENASVISALLEELEKDFPNQLPINTYPDIQEIRRLQGHQEVLQAIRNLVEPEDHEG